VIDQAMATVAGASFRAATIRNDSIAGADGAGGAHPITPIDIAAAAPSAPNRRR
jgi:hypothetical protein